MDFLTNLLGGQTLGFYIAAMIFIALGQLLNKVLVYKNKGFVAPFDFWYWVKDNWRDITLAVLLSFITVRFTDEIVGFASRTFNADVSYIADNMFYYLLLGLAYQTIVHWLREKLSFLRLNKNSLGDTRSK